MKLSLCLGSSPKLWKMQWICHSPQTGWENFNKFLPYTTTKGIYGNGKLTSSGKLSDWGCELTCVCTWNPGSAWCMIEVISSLRIVKFALIKSWMFVIDFNLVNLSIITCLICPIIGKESSWGLSNHKHVNSSPSANPQKGKTKGEIFVPARDTNCKLPQTQTWN